MHERNRNTATRASPQGLSKFSTSKRKVRSVEVSPIRSADFMLLTNLFLGCFLPRLTVVFFHSDNEFVVVCNAQTANFHSLAAFECITRMFVWSFQTLNLKHVSPKCYQTNNVVVQIEQRQFIIVASLYLLLPVFPSIGRIFSHLGDFQESCGRSPGSFHPLP